MQLSHPISYGATFSIRWSNLAWFINVFIASFIDSEYGSKQYLIIKNARACIM